MTDHQDNHAIPYIYLPGIAVEEPWQEKPAKILQYAANHLANSSDFSRYVGFLLTDVGVELTLKTYLRLPEEIVETGQAWSKRQVEPNVGFATLLDKVWTVAEKKVSGLKAPTFQHYHDLRNALYHDPHSSPPELRHCVEYLTIAHRLLDALLKVSISLADVPGTSEYAERQAVQVKRLEEHEVARQQYDRVQSLLIGQIERITEDIFPQIYRPTVMNRIVDLLSDWFSAEHQALFMPKGRDLPHLLALLEHAAVNDRKDVREYVSRYVIGVIKTGIPYATVAGFLGILRSMFDYPERKFDPKEILAFVVAANHLPIIGELWFELDQAEFLIRIAGDPESWALGHADEKTIATGLNMLDKIETQLSEITEAGE